jgi:hypothetical protein
MIDNLHHNRLGEDRYNLFDVKLIVNRAQPLAAEVFDGDQPLHGSDPTIAQQELIDHFGSGPWGENKSSRQVRADLQGA